MNEGLKARGERLALQEDRCRAVRLAIAGVARREPPPIPPEPSAKDFYLFGVLGAKNVGKSSLVAAVLGVRHEPEEGRDLGEGTRRPRVFATPELTPRIQELLTTRGVESDPAREAGRAGQLSRVAFLDLPDIESRFEDHLGAVVKIHREIDGLIVVRTAESSWDDAFLAKLRAFRRPQLDMFIVMNKFDDWVAARGGDEAEARAVCTEHLAQVLRDLELSTEDVYLTDARPEGAREGGGYDLPRLARDLLSDKSDDELEAARLRAWVFQLRMLTEALRQATELPAGRARLGQLMERVAAEASAAASGSTGGLVPVGLYQSLARMLERVFESSERLELAESRLTRQVFFHRVDALPFARILAAPLLLGAEVVDGIFGRFPRLASGVPQLPGGDPHEAAAVLRAVADAINGGLALERAALAELFQEVPERVLEVEEAARRVQMVLDDWFRRQEEAVKASVTRPWLGYRLLMVLPVAWFFLFRPTAELWVAADGGAAALAAALPRVLLDLTAPYYLLLSAVSLAVIYGIVLASEYRGALATVRRADFLEAHRERWVREVEREFWRELLEEAIPDRFRMLAAVLEDAEGQLTAVDRVLGEVDPEAVADAERQARGAG